MYNLCNPFSPRQSYAVHLSLWTQLCCFITHIIMATQSNAGYYADRKQPERCQTDDRWPQLVDAVAGMLQEDDLRVEMNLTKIEVWTEGREGGGGVPRGLPRGLPWGLPWGVPHFYVPWTHSWQVVSYETAGTQAGKASGMCVAVRQAIQQSLYLSARSLLFLKEIATNILICCLGSSYHSSGSGCYML